MDGEMLTVDEAVDALLTWLQEADASDIADVYEFVFGGPVVWVFNAKE